MCQACMQKAKGGKPGTRCCADYGTANRVDAVFIKHMKMVRDARCARRAVMCDVCPQE